MRRETREVDPRKFDASRRRFLKNAGALVAAVPAAGLLLEACGSSHSSVASTGKAFSQGKDPWPDHPNYTFALVNHVTTNPFFVPTRYGAQDACTLLGCNYTWTGSQNSIVSQMVDAMDTAIDRKVDGIGVPIIDPTAFIRPTNRALEAGIPVVAYNANPPANSGNNVMAYIGQDLTEAGVVSGERILKYVKPGDLVVGFIATPGTLNLQPRIDGAEKVLKAAGIDFVEVGTGASLTSELSSIEAWYLGHTDVKFMYAVDDGSTDEMAKIITKYNLTSKGIHGSGYDVGQATLDDVHNGSLEWTIDQQAYLQGFLPILQLFLYQISGGLLRPVDTDTGLKIVTKSTVAPYFDNKDRYEGSSATEKILTPPSTLPV
jgi:simple sugar transport system substrate-binding protein